MHPNASFSSLVVPPSIQCVKLEKLSNLFLIMSIKCDVKCDNIVKNNHIDLSSKKFILIKEKIQHNNNIKYNVISFSNKNIPCRVFNKKETNVGCDFPNENVLEPFNETNKNEEHLNNFVQLTKKKKKPLTKIMTTKILLNIRKILKTLLNMDVIVVKHCVLHFKFVLFLKYILTFCLMI
jgi:hypothetical protein